MSLIARFSSRSAPACFRLMFRSYQTQDPKFDKPHEHEDGKHSLPYQDQDMDTMLEKDGINGRPASPRKDYESDAYFFTQKRYLHAASNDGNKYLKLTSEFSTSSYQLDSEKKSETLKKEIEAVSLGGQRSTIEKCDHEVTVADSSLEENSDEQKTQLVKFHSPKELYVILDLNGVLIKRWAKNPSLPGIHKVGRKWIQLRPGCIEFLHKAFSFFRVGIWSTMTRANVTSVCAILEHLAHKPLPFFMVWDKESCYRHGSIHRPDKRNVTADFKPLYLVWKRFPYLNFQNTVLVDDSPYKACMNNPDNCIFPDEFNGCTNDSFLVDVLCPYLEAMQKTSDVKSFVANYRLGQQPITVRHKLYKHVQPVMEKKWII